ncbi:ABC transporter substrate-binding protein [Gracilinema caldarium]|uniref:Extracellular solute-binding protein family 1 n=1 Tax=Gracilinema caldarium (strain ATCC 51460 / DSM 7334 / H1) TaxID=744872 RepID=F8EYS1_GRAC1|nr:sugar ABC transporter substrate-binding protein [Gracilinema caldarium]AEJ18867.1 extracellular solute-binding protein family 1 [Gracilinema caldarium DSM 7334]
MTFRLKSITFCFLFLGVSLLFATPESKKKTTLSFWTFQELHTTFMKDAVESWNNTHPNEQIELKMDVLPYDDLHNKLLISLQAGVGAPDIVDIEISKFANFIKSKNPPLVPLNKYLKNDLDKVIIGRMDSYKKDGNYYGIDYHVGASVIYYNIEILNQAGVDINKIVTWDDFYSAGKQVLSRTGKPMCTVESTEHWSFYPLIVQQGSDFLDKNGNGQLDNPINVKTLEFLKKLVDEGVAIIAPGGYHHSEEYWSFMNNSGAASVWMPLWYMGRFTSYMPKLSGKIAVRPLPVWTKGGARSAGMGGTGTAITKQSKYQDLACRFLVYAKASKEGSIKTWTILGFDPIRWDAWSDPAMKAKNQYTDYFGSSIFDMLLSIKDEIKGINVSSKFPQAVTLVQKNVMFKVLGEKSMTPQQALSEANKILNSK